MLEVGQHELARRAVLHRAGLAGVGVDQLCVNKPACTEMHAVLRFPLSPERYADVADSHCFGDLRAPPLFELCSKRRLAASRLAPHPHTLDARRREVTPL